MNRPSIAQPLELQPQQQQHNPQPASDEQSSPPLPPTSTHPLYKTAPGGQSNKNTGAAPSSAQFNYVASNAEPPKVAFYPAVNSTAVGNSNNNNNKPPGSNPWDREEREKEQEMRRDQMRHWRDQQIAELSSCAQRSQQQEEQLKTLILERDFERRAQMDSEGGEDGEEEEEDEGAADGPYQTHSNGEDMGMMVPSVPSSGVATMQPKSILKGSSNAALISSGGGNEGSGGGASSGSMGSPSHSNHTSPMKQTVKTASFSDQVMTHRHLSFDGTDQMNNNSPVLSQLTKEMTHLAMSNVEGALIMDQQQQMYQQQMHGELYPEYPPPPPERNSSYVFMSQQQQKLRTHQQQQQMMGGQQQQQMFENTMNNNNSGGAPVIMNGQGYMNGGTGPLSPTGGVGGAYANGGNNNGNFMIPPPANFNSSLVRGDNKRVSFHDEDNNNAQQMMMMQGAGGEAYMAGGVDLAKIREDPDVSRAGEGNCGRKVLIRLNLQKFIDETQAMLDTPQTPDGVDKANWNMAVTQTPGVIGAQEVYRWVKRGFWEMLDLLTNCNSVSFRDVRTRRLAEKEKNKEEAAIPEKMTFKEKMKLFCENQTPKDKVKISRAQRDIDAH